MPWCSGIEVLIPRLGEATGHAISSVTLSVAILTIAILTAKWLHSGTTRCALGIGAIWLTLTLAFEFLGGHYLFHNPWDRLLADYNLRGRIWILVLITTTVAPLIGWRIGNFFARGAENFAVR